MKEKLYEELCHNYRFFLTWRHAAFAGNILAIGGTIALSISALKQSPEIAYLLPLFASPIGIFLWLLDIKIRKIYRAIHASGEQLEDGYEGYFKSLRKVGASFPRGNTSKEDKASGTKFGVSHSGLLNFVYWSSFIGMLLLSCLLNIKYA